MTTALLEILNPAVENARVDIVFVHGLNPLGSPVPEHARKTWTHNNGFFWPDSVVGDIQSARVMVFGWDSAVLGDSSNASLNEHANDFLDELRRTRADGIRHRPLVFVSHSMGGLLVKQALITSKLNPRYECIRQSTSGLMFFATPHRGGNWAGLADFTANICSSVGGSPKNSLLQQLKGKSLLNEISLDQFSYQTSDYEIISYYETKLTRVKIKGRRVLPKMASMYIVDKDSAKMSIARESSLSLERNHSEICKFTGDEDRAFQRVGPKLKELASIATAHRVRCPHDANGLSEVEVPQRVSYANENIGSMPSNVILPRRKSAINVPPPGSPLLVGRSEVLQQVRDCLGHSADQIPRRISLSGVGGVGKTELAIQVVNCLGSYKFILWLSTTDKQAFDADLMRCAYSLRGEFQRLDANISRSGDSERFRLYFPEFHTAPLDISFEIWIKSIHDDSSRVLVVLDDLDGLDPDDRRKTSRIFATDTIDMIYTTRNPVLGEKGGFWPAQLFRLPPLSEANAMKLLRSMSDKSPSGSSAEKQHEDWSEVESVVAREVVHRLDCIPAAIIIGSQFARHQYGPNSFPALREMLKNWPEERILSFSRETTQWPHSIYSSLDISQSRLRRDLSLGKREFDVTELSLALLWFLSRSLKRSFDRDEVIRLCHALGVHLSSQPRQELQNKFRPLIEDQEQARDCIAKLLQVSLLTENHMGFMLLDRLTMCWAIKSCSKLINISSNTADMADLFEELQKED